MTKTKLIKLLKEYKSMNNVEDLHMLADQALLDYINDKNVTDIFISLDKWYS